MPVFESKEQYFLGQYGISKYILYWNPSNQVLHVGDLCIGGTYSVLHSMMHNTMDFVCILRKQFEDSFGFKPPNHFRLFLYKADGKVVEWIDDNVRSIKQAEFTLIHIPYLKKRVRGKYDKPTKISKTQANT